MKKRTLTKHLLTVVLLIHTYLSHALPFNIEPTPGTVLPTQLTPNQTTTGLYTIVNKTASIRSGNTIHYLPPNVSQITSNTSYPDLCGSTFTLQPYNTAGDSCTLQLLISGAVNANDPNPTHQLFACFPGNKACAGTRSPLDVSMIPGAPVIAAVGSYFSQDLTAPIDIQTTLDNGNTWTQQSVPLLSTGGYLFATLLGVDCADNACVGAGFYGDEERNSIATVAASTDNGQSWFQQALTAPPGFHQGKLAGITCQDHACTAVGSYQNDTTGQTQPAIVTTINTGATWAQQVLDLPNGYIAGDMYGVSCMGSTCIGVGTLETISMFDRLAVFTNTNGGGWSSGQTLNSNIGALYGVTCSDAVCISVGFYVNGSNNVGVVFSSTNQGLSWIQQPDITFTNFTQAQLNGASCTDTFCVAVGAVIGGASLSNFPWSPAVALGGPEGTGWSTQVLPIVSGYGSCQLNGVKCTGTTCIAAGACCSDSAGPCGPAPYGFGLPLLAISHDSGHTWTENSVTTLPPGALAAGFNAVG